METNKKIRGKKKNKIISFDEEIVTRDKAENFFNDKINSFNHSEINFDSVVNDTSKPHYGKATSGIKVPNKEVTKNTQSHNSSNSENRQKIKPKKKKLTKMAENTESIVSQEEFLATEISEETTEEPKPPKKESKRAQKRKKHEEQLSSKKLKTELLFQEKALNYLSKWKHCKSEWKFEKLRQVWLQQSIFDPSKIPDEFWEIAVEYFSGSQGRSRQQLIDEALKIVEKEGETECADENKLKRARDIIQCVQ